MHECKDYVDDSPDCKPDGWASKEIGCFHLKNEVDFGNSNVDDNESTFLMFLMNPLKGCDECLVGLNYLTCHEMNKICFDKNRNEINQEIMCLTEEEFNQQPRDYPLNECLPKNSSLDYRFDSLKIIGYCSYLNSYLILRSDDEISGVHTATETDPFTASCSADAIWKVSINFFFSNPIF